MDWQPISSAPRDGTTLLLKAPDGRIGIGLILEEKFDGMDLTRDPAAWCGQLRYESRPSVSLGGLGAQEAIGWMHPPP
jgi:hypothetical protein